MKKLSKRLPEATFCLHPIVPHIAEKVTWFRHLGYLQYQIIKFGHVEMILKCDLPPLNLNVMHGLDSERKTLCEMIMKSSI